MGFQPAAASVVVVLAYARAVTGLAVVAFVAVVLAYAQAAVELVLADLRAAVENAPVSHAPVLAS